MITSITMLISQLCNLKCPHCCSSSSSLATLDKEVTTEELVSLFRKLPDLKNIKISGGEPLHPLVYSKTKSVLDFCLENNIKVQLNTNGTFEFPFKDFSKENITFQVSLDGMRDCHDNIRGKGVFDKAVEFIKIYRDKGFEVIVATVICDDDIERIVELSKFVNEELKVFQRVQFVSSSGRAEELNETQNINRDQVINKLKSKDIPCRSITTKCNNLLSSAKGSNLSFDFNGNIIPCPNLAKYKFGHINNFDEVKTRMRMLRMLQGVTCYYTEGVEDI